MFEWRRFLRLAAAHWAEQGRSHLWFIGIGVAVHLCVVLLVTQAGRGFLHYELEMQLIVFVFGLLLSGMLFAGRYFSTLSRRGADLTALMRPCSTFEKWLLALLVVVVAYPVAYTLAFQLCNVPAALLGEAARDAKLLALAHEEINGNPWLKNLNFGPYIPFTDRKLLPLETHLWLGTVALQGLVVAGTLFFRRLALLKTLLAVFVIAVVLIPLLVTAVNARFDRLFWVEPTFWLPLPLPMLVAAWTLVPALFWIGNAFLLREREAL